MLRGKRETGWPGDGEIYDSRTGNKTQTSDRITRKRRKENIFIVEIL